MFTPQAFIQDPPQGCEDDSFRCVDVGAVPTSGLFRAWLTPMRTPRVSSHRHVLIMERADESLADYIASCPVNLPSVEGRAIFRYVGDERAPNLDPRR